MKEKHVRALSTFVSDDVVLIHFTDHGRLQCRESFGKS